MNRLRLFDAFHGRRIRAAGSTWPFAEPAAGEKNGRTGRREQQRRRLRAPLIVNVPFGDSIRGLTETAMVNEVFCEFICHNLCCLIQEEAELGIRPDFMSEKAERRRKALAQ